MQRFAVKLFKCLRRFTSRHARGPEPDGHSESRDEHTYDDVDVSFLDLDDDELLRELEALDALEEELEEEMVSSSSGPISSSRARASSSSSGALVDKLGTQVVVPLPSLQKQPDHDASIKDASCCICMCDFEPGESARVSQS
jgi:hypothetical protein